ncbi:MAG TPA: creatininase family protein [Candidatus Dormibacteraeota bacterium]|nr:creatininase family protein [Candidatus Dormibacteraeota bacterium]
MRVADLNWMQMEEYLRRDDRIVLPLGSTEQHGYLSLATDAILAERVSVEAAEPLGVPVLPALAYGITPYFAAYPGSPSLNEDTYLMVVGELLDSLQGQGFKRFLLVNGHGGNRPVEALASSNVAVHEWWSAPKTMGVVRGIDPEASHASWMENFPWTRLPGVALPNEHKPPTPRTSEDPTEVRKTAGDGSFGGWYSRPDEDVMRVWRTGVEETREVLARL